MWGYAIRLQRLFLVKNLLCGWFAISPLVGAALFVGSSSSNGIMSTSSTSTSTFGKLWRLAAVGFPMHVSREIVKDIEDVDIDRIAPAKWTLPLVLGERTAHRLAYGMVFMVCSVMIVTPTYWTMFASRYPIYPLGVAVGLSMCFQASRLPVSQGQRLLKASIYVLLAGMIGGLWMPY
jgi:4-hydroxybenzoate polyprenyltransferase